MRMEPPPSVPWAMGTVRAATCAAEPPEEPPAVRSGAQGLCARPKLPGSVTGMSESSGTLVVPSTTSPAARKRRTSSLSRGGAQPRQMRLPLW